MKPFSEIREDLEPDGALRDFYIENTSVEDWNKFISSIPKLCPLAKFMYGGEITNIPTSFEEIRKLQSTNSTTLSIQISDKIVNCHFFTEEEIELDFVPNDIRDEKDWKEMIFFFQSLVNVIGLRGIITQENWPNYVIEEIKPN